MRIESKIKWLENNERMFMIVVLLTRDMGVLNLFENSLEVLETK